MARVRLIHWNGPEGRERTLRLASLGHHAAFDDANGPALLRLLRTSEPDVFVIDLSRLPSHGREVGLWLRSTQGTRHVPIVFVDGDRDKVGGIKELLPDATYTSWSRIKTALSKAISRRVPDPVVPPSPIYSNRPVSQKLGIRAGMRVCLVNAPVGIASMLEGTSHARGAAASDASPAAVTYTARPVPACDLFVVFGRSQRELALGLASLLPAVARQTVWCAWPKQSSGLQTDLDGNVVRASGLAAGLVDFKVCAIDATWSGLAFKRRS